MKKGEYRTYVEERTNEENVGKGHSTNLLYLQNRGSNTKNKKKPFQVKNILLSRIFGGILCACLPACCMASFSLSRYDKKISSTHRKIKTEINTWNINSKSRRVSYTANEEQDEDRMWDYKREASRDSSLFSKHLFYFI